MFTADDLITKTDQEIILDYLNTVSDEIKELATSKGMVASGRTLASLEVLPTNTGGQLLANSNIYFLEHGRGPTSAGASGSGRTLVEIIEEWIQDKGLDLNPYAVARTIHEKGTVLYRKGGNSGVLSIPLQLKKLDEVIDSLALGIMAKSTSEIFKSLTTLK